ncbi:diphthamide synthesis protein [Candidatus Woesearchaeota archaeon]|nr:diphthamide synthesis protein [Candidatus Woesearchaeota archaeon]
MKYDLELENVVEEIKKQNARLVCIQLPDRLKKYAGDIRDRLERETKAEVFIWLGSCYGACDVPNIKVDLLVQWGHEKWNS